MAVLAVQAGAGESDAAAGWESRSIRGTGDQCCRTGIARNVRCRHRLARSLYVLYESLNLGEVGEKGLDLAFMIYIKRIGPGATRYIVTGCGRRYFLQPTCIHQCLHVQEIVPCVNEIGMAAKADFNGGPSVFARLANAVPVVVPRGGAVLPHVQQISSLATSQRVPVGASGEPSSL